MAQHTAKTLFDKNIVSARTCVELFDGLPAPTAKLNTKWLLRAAVVFAVSALDTYFHDKIKYRVGRFRLSKLPPQLARVEVPLGDLEKWHRAQRKGNVLRNWVTGRLVTRSLQSPDEIADALKLVGINGFWPAVAGNSGSAASMKTNLNALIRRRNQIAHEGDRQQSRRSGKKLRRIGRKTVVGWIDFVQHIVNNTEDRFPG